MSESIIIRHSKPEKSWDCLSYEELLQLLQQKYEPEIDCCFFDEYINTSKISQMKISLIICSPSYRAMQTAQKIAKIMKLPIMTFNQFNEISFQDLPFEQFVKGKDQIKDYLINQTKITDIIPVISAIKQIPPNTLIISHGFLMRKMYSHLFGIELAHLKNDKRFTQYLSGFNINTGEFVSLKK